MAPREYLQLVERMLEDGRTGGKLRQDPILKDRISVSSFGTDTLPRKRPQNRQYCPQKGRKMAGSCQ